MRLEKAINPLLDDDDLVSFSYLLEAVVEKMKAVEGVGLFMIAFWNVFILYFYPSFYL